MNTLESCFIVSPKNNNDECAKFVIDDIGSPFILSEIMEIGTRYTFSFWIKSDANSSIQTASSIFNTSTEWQKHSIVFVADSKDLSIIFLNAGEYYMYHPKLETGNTVTDWSPAPEDLDPTDELAETNERVQGIYEYASFIEQSVNGISTKVGESKKIVDDLGEQLKVVDEKASEFSQTAEQFKLDIITKINTDGVTKVSTTSGVFDDRGLTVDNDESATKTTISPDGMTVYQKKSSTETVTDEAVVLKATSDGVDATNLHANTYLIIGGRSRFENYGTNRTGCFWIGG